MKPYSLLHRLFDLFLVLFGVSVMVFSMLRLLPGDTAIVMLGPDTGATPERLAELRARLGLDQPFPIQYCRWVFGMVEGDFGSSLWTDRPVREEITEAMKPTFELCVLALVLGVALAVPLGCWMAVSRRPIVTAALRIGTVAGLATPPFWLGILMLYLADALLPHFATVGYVPLPAAPLQNLSRMLLPAFALAVPILAQLSTLLRASMIEALGQRYVLTARGKGAPEWRVVYVHALRNAFIPFITGAGIQIGYLLGGAVAIEEIFVIPGFGRLMLGAISQRDYPIIQAAILIATFGFVGINFLVDLFVCWIDPRLQE